jgi:hypothetical protein
MAAANASFPLEKAVSAASTVSPGGTPNCRSKSSRSIAARASSEEPGRDPAALYIR